MFCLVSRRPRSDGGGGVAIRVGVETAGLARSPTGRFDDKPAATAAGGSELSVMSLAGGERD